MTEVIWAALIVAVSTIVSAYITARNVAKKIDTAVVPQIKETHNMLNDRLTKALLAERLAGREEGRREEAARHDMERRERGDELHG